jgi:hypothetical protein
MSSHRYDVRHNNTDPIKYKDVIQDQHGCIVQVNYLDKDENVKRVKRYKCRRSNDNPPRQERPRLSAHRDSRQDASRRDKQKDLDKVVTTVGQLSKTAGLAGKYYAAYTVCKPVIDEIALTREFNTLVVKPTQAVADVLFGKEDKKKRRR